MKVFRTTGVTAWEGAPAELDDIIPPPPDLNARIRAAARGASGAAAEAEAEREARLKAAMQPPEPPEDPPLAVRAAAARAFDATLVPATVSVEEFNRRIRAARAGGGQ